MPAGRSRRLNKGTRSWLKALCLALIVGATVTYFLDLGRLRWLPFALFTAAVVIGWIINDS